MQLLDMRNTSFPGGETGEILGVSIGGGIGDVWPISMLGDCLICPSSSSSFRLTASIASGALWCVHLEIR